jgi:cytochrome b subunit of formate dehydrogenase
MNEYIQRFSVRQRIEHFTVMVLFLMLGLTGFAQKFFDAPWAVWTITMIGGIDRVRWLHRAAGITFTVFAIFHISIGLFMVLTRRSRPSMIASRKDFLDAITQLRYYLRISDKPASFDRFDYRQKFEYWGMVLGGMLMIATGFMLLYPVIVTRFLPGQFIPVARVAHSNEGLLAFLIVIIWHVFNAHLSPEAFPFDPSIFTGKVTREYMEKEHPLEYARIMGQTEEKQEAQTHEVP